MLSLEDIRKIDPELSDVSDAELEEVLATLYELGRLAYDVQQIEKSGSKNPVGSLTDETGEASITT